jgi:Putative Actinobacterial Holin-X, holin superfamily III
MAGERSSSGSDVAVPARGAAPGETTEVQPAAVPREPTTGELLKGLADDATELVRQEVLLAKQEMTEGLAAGAKAGSLLAAAGVLALYGFGFLLAAAAAAIDGPAWLGPLIVGGGLALLAAILGLVGRRRLAGSKVAPAKARAELKETATELREEIRWVRPRRRPPERSS